MCVSSLPARAHLSKLYRVLLWCISVNLVIFIGAYLFHYITPKLCNKLVLLRGFFHTCSLIGISLNASCLLRYLTEWVTRVLCYEYARTTSIRSARTYVVDRKKSPSFGFSQVDMYGYRIIDNIIDGSTARRCTAIVTNERALLSKLGQPVRKVRQSAVLCISSG